MAKILIGDFLIWEKQDDGDAKYSYLDDSVTKIGNKHIPIFNALFENTLKYDNYITINEIAEIIDKQGYSINYDTVKKAVQRIRQDPLWKNAIESSHSGYRIRYRLYEEKESVVASPSVSDEIETYDPLTAPLPVPEPKAPIIDNSPVLVSFGRNDTYVKNFIRDKCRVRTYFYQTDSRDVFDVFQPLTLIGEDENNTYKNICFKDLYKDSKRHRYVVSAPVGSGKSLLARKLALEAAISFSEAQIVPILYDLSSFTQTEKTLFEIIKDDYESYFPDEQQDTDTDFSFYCQCGNVLLLLDGFEELKPRLKDDFIRKLKSFLRSYSNNTIIVFSRPVSNFAELDSFTVLGIKQVVDEEAEKLIDSLLDGYGNNPDDVKEHVLSKQKLSMFTTNLYGNSLFISMICYMDKYYRSIEKPEIHEDLEDFIRYVSGEVKTVQHKRFSRINFSLAEFDEELCDFCFYLVMSNNDSFDDRTVNDCWTAYNAGKRFTAHDFLDELCKTYGLIQFQNGKYEFIDYHIVIYYYAKTVINHGIVRQSFLRTMNDCHAYPADDILDLLYEMDSEAVSKALYCPLIHEITSAVTNTNYEEFLLRFYPQIEYYVGEGDYELNNRPHDYVYRHLVKDWAIEEDINHLVFPAIESLKSVSIYKVDSKYSLSAGKNEGLVEEWLVDLYIRDKSEHKLAGHVYRFKMEDALRNNDETSCALRLVLMSDDFPLFKEFEEAVSLYEEYEAEK